MKKVIVLGGSGMLGHMLVRVLSNDCEVAATLRVGSGLKFAANPWFAKSRIVPGVDATKVDSIRSVMSELHPDVVVNAIGLVKQRPEAKDTVMSIQVNALFPHVLAGVCRNAGARLIHISTDCVFSGRKGNYKETDEPDPVDIYDRTKLLGEIEGERILTIRTSLVGRELIRSSGLVEWFLANRDGEVKGFTRAVFSGVSTHALAHMIRTVIAEHPDLVGLYHFASRPISKFDLLVQLNEAAGLNIKINPVDAPALDRSLNADKFWDVTGYQSPTWEEIIERMVPEIPWYDRLRGEEGLASRVA